MPRVKQTLLHWYCKFWFCLGFCHAWLSAIGLLLTRAKARKYWELANKYKEKAK